MKENMLRLFLASLFLVSSLPIQLLGQTTEAVIDGLKYNLDDETLTAEIIRNGTLSKGDIIIPSVVNNGGKTYRVTSIGRLAFFNCYELLSVSIPNTVNSIGQQAFSYCNALKSITIPKSVTSIDRPFIYCPGLETIVVGNGNPVYSSPANCNAIILSAENKLVAGCKGTVIPEGVDCIKGDAFTGMTGLTSIKLPLSLKTLEYRAFAGCGLTSIVIPRGVTNIETGAFHSCTELISVKVEDGNTVYSSPNGSNAVVETATKTLVVGCKTTVIPQNVKIILSNTFAGQTGITSLNIPEGVEEIGDAAFQACNFETVLLPHSVKKVNSAIFQMCANLKTVYIGKGLQNMMSMIFYQCEKLSDLYLAAPTPPIAINSFGYLPPTAAVTLHVPAESVEAYQQDNNWGVFHVVALKDGEFPEPIAEAVQDSADVEGAYKLWVNGIRVTDTNRLDVLGDGNGNDNPSVMFDGLHTLVLSNADLDSIVCQMSNEMVIFVQGDNKVGNNKNPAIHHTGREKIPLTITTSGNYPGSFTITSDVKLTEGFSQINVEHLQLLSDENYKVVYGPLISPFTKDAAITFKASDFMIPGAGGESEEIDLSNRVVNNVLYTLHQENEDGFWEDENSMVLNTVMPQNPSFGDGVVGSASFAENFAGMTLMIPAGEGDIIIDNMSTQGYVMGVKIGSGQPYTYTNPSRTQNTIHYKVSVPSYVYIYNAGLSGSASDRLRGGKKTTTRIVVHSIVIKPQNISSSNEVQGIIPSSQTIDMNPVIVDTHISDLYVNRKNAGSWYNLNGQQIDRPKQRGIYIFNGRKFIMK